MKWPRKKWVGFIIGIAIGIPLGPLLAKSSDHNPVWVNRALAVLLLAGLPILAFRAASLIRRGKIPVLSPLKRYLLGIPWVLFPAMVACDLLFKVSPDSVFDWFDPLDRRALVVWIFILVFGAAGIAWSVIGLKRAGWLPREPQSALLIPHTRAEKIVCVLVFAPVIGICEEFLYRGYLYHEVSAWVHSVPLAVAITSLAFGLAHAHQGPAGFVRGTLLGGLFAVPVVRLGVIYPSMFTHFLYDAVVLAWLGPKLIRAEQSPA